MSALLPFLMLGILLAAILTRPLERLRFPSVPVALMAFGYIASEGWVWLGYDTGLRWEILRDLVFYLLLPVLVFEAAITINLRALRRDGWLIFLLAVPLLLLASFAAASLLVTLLGTRLSLAWPLAILIGAMISATDPTRINPRVRPAGDPDTAGKADQPGRISRLLAGEGLVNDAVTITLFTVLIGIMAAPELAIDPLKTSGLFLLVLVGSALLGTTLGWLFDLVIGPADDKVIATSATLVLAFTAFGLAENVLALSGVMTTVAAGATVAWRQRRQRRDEDIAFALDSWRLLSFCAGAMLFFLVGMSITAQMFQDHWQAMLAGIVAGGLSRFLIVFAGAGPLSRLPGLAPLSLREQGLLTLGGIRGAVAIALALSLPVTIDGWYLVQSTVYGVALFSLVVQAPLFSSLAQRTVAR